MGWFNGEYLQENIVFTMKYRGSRTVESVEDREHHWMDSRGCMGISEYNGDSGQTMGR